MANGTTLKAPARIAREIPHTVSPGLWALAWKRLKSDSVGMVSLAIVAAFIVLMIASGTGLVAGDWAKETGVNYAPPSFLGADIEGGAPAAPVTPPAPAAPAVEYKSEVVDPLADVLAEIRGEKKPRGRGRRAGRGDAGKSVDPLADVMADIRKDAKSAPRPRSPEARRADAAVRRRQVGPRRPQEDDQGLGDVDLRRPRRRALVATLHRHAVRRARRLLRQLGRRLRSTGSTACSARFRTCC